MKNQNRNYILLIIIIFCNTYQKAANSNYENKNNFHNNNLNNIIKSGNIKNKKTLFKDELNNIIYFIAENIDESQQEIKNKLNSFDIISNSQSRIDNKFIAEGDIIIKQNNMILKADKLIYDLDKKILSLKGNIKFKSEEQYIQASELKYNANKKSGYIRDAYGIVNFETLESINIYKNINIDPDKFITFDEEIKNVNQNETSDLKFNNMTFKNLKFKNFLKPQNIQNLNYDINVKKKWRFQSSEIKIKENIWYSDLFFITNDPFNKPQIIIENSNLQGIYKKDKTKYKSKNSTFIIEDFLRIPIGSRNYTEGSETDFKWGIGYDKGKKDGLFIQRNASPIYFGTQNTKLKLKNEFYIQRSLYDKTNSFSGEGESVLEKTTEQKPNFSDYLGLSAELESKILGFDFASKILLNSLDFKKFKKIANINSEISKIIFEKQNDNSSENIKLSFFGVYREKVWNGSLGNRDVLTSYGLKVEKEFRTSNTTNKYGIGYGEFQATERSNSKSIISRNRFNIYFNNENNINIWESLKEKNYDKKFKYTPSIINSKIDLYISTKIDFYNYDDNSYQKLYTFTAGPKLIIGNFKRFFLDYTELNIFPKTTIAHGQSPFGFDQSVDNQLIELNLKQQLFGPILLGLSTEYNLDLNSTNFKEFTNLKYELSWNRRAYNVTLSYDIEREKGSINFQINSFDFDGIGNKFK